MARPSSNLLALRGSTKRIWPRYRVQHCLTPAGCSLLLLPTSDDQSEKLNTILLTPLFSNSFSKWIERSHMLLPWQELLRVELLRLSSLLQRTHRPLFSSWQHSVLNNISQTQEARDFLRCLFVQKSYMKKSIVRFEMRCNTERRFNTARLQGKRRQSIRGTEPKRAATAHLYVSVFFFLLAWEVSYLLRLVLMAESF